MQSVRLSEFIRDALVEIATGIKEANTALKNPDANQYEPFILRKNIGDNAKIPGIKFDVAVTADQAQKDKASFVVAILNLGGVASTEKTRAIESAHRIQFEVGIDSTWR